VKSSNIFFECWLNLALLLSLRTLLRRFVQVVWLVVFLLTLSGCADRPSFISIKKVMGNLEKSESLSEVIEVQGMQKLKSYKNNNSFVVEVYFEQHFLLGFREAAELTESTIDARNLESSTVLAHEQINRHELIENMLTKKYGHFKEGELRRRYSKLVFRKSDNQWSFDKKTQHWKDFDLSYFPSE